MPIVVHSDLHIEEETLELYFLGRLSNNQSMILLTHCAECPRCFKKAAEEQQFVRMMQDIALELSLVEIVA